MVFGYVGLSSNNAEPEFEPIIPDTWRYNLKTGTAVDSVALYDRSLHHPVVCSEELPRYICSLFMLVAEAAAAR